MQLIDVNVLINASHPEAVDHARFRDWLDNMLKTSRPFALTDMVAVGFMRIMTNPDIFDGPYTTDQALTAISNLRSRSFCTWLHHCDSHWTTFETLCRAVGVTGNLVNDAWLAAMAIDHNCELISADRDFARFPGLRWRHPLDAAP